MKTIITLICLLIAMSFGAKAQTFVTIPDANFVAYLQTNFPACMSGNQMDITCSGIQNSTFISISGKNISDLTGIEYFINLQDFRCNSNPLTSLPTLPNSLKVLDCSYNQLTSLPALPNSIQHLFCRGNQLINLPALPDSLQTLNSSYNQLTTLPTLPNSLKQLKCWNNQLTSLPTLPNTIYYLELDSNQLTSIPALPSSLLYFSCYDNQITSFPTLPDSLLNLWCSSNLLTSIPALPNTLRELECHHNQLTSLPTLPTSLRYLQCHNNQLTNLPPFPDFLFAFSCENNNISCFPTFPGSIYYFSISGNPFTCLPNYISSMNSTFLAYPLCIDGDSINNPYDCNHAQGISGTTYNDNTSNCHKDASDPGYSNVHLKLYDNSNTLIAQMYSFSNGVYDFPESFGTYTLKLDTAGVPYSSLCVYPGIDSAVILTNANPLAANVNFDIACKPGYDVGIKSALRQGWVFPGMQHRLSIVAGDMSNWYNLHCAAGQSGQVQITLSGSVTFDSIPVGSLSPSIAGNVFTYPISDFGNVNMQNDFGLLFTTDTSAQAGDQICVNVVVTPTIGDNNTNNNNYQFCYNVVNSYDPNLKEVYPIDVGPGYQDWLTYTIHFQNTGTAPAMNIRLTDTLDNNLDLETFQVINYSHYNTVSVNGNVLTVHFPNIQLPDSTSNLAGSQGFVQYRIKPKANLPAGTQIKNTANIYFDYNPAIVTNTTTNNFIQALAINENRKNATLNVYPNPGNGKYFVKLSEGVDFSKLKIEVYNLLGEQILTSKMQNSLSEFDLSKEPNGIYFLRIIGGKQSLNQRVVKQ